MITVEKSIHINRPAADVFEFISQFSNDAKWQSGLVRSEKTSDGPVGMGTRGTYVQKVMGREVTNNVEVTVYEPPTRFGAKTTSGPVQFEFLVTFEEMGGGTHLNMHMQGEAGGFFKVAEGLVKKELEKTFDTDLEKLKQILEA